MKGNGILPGLHHGEIPALPRGYSLLQVREEINRVQQLATLPKERREGGRGMMFRLTWERDGVVMECHTDLLKGRFEWVRLRKFLTEGDALLFQMMRCPKMTDNEVKILARQYVGSDHFAYIAGRWAKTIR